MSASRNARRKKRTEAQDWTDNRKPRTTPVFEGFSPIAGVLDEATTADFVQLGNSIKEAMTAITKTANTVFDSFCEPIKDLTKTYVDATNTLIDNFNLLPPVDVPKSPAPLYVDGLTYGNSWDQPDADPIKDMQIAIYQMNQINQLGPYVHSSSESEQWMEKLWRILPVPAPKPITGNPFLDANKFMVNINNRDYLDETPEYYRNLVITDTGYIGCTKHENVDCEDITATLLNSVADGCLFATLMHCDDYYEGRTIMIPIGSEFIPVSAEWHSRENGPTTIDISVKFKALKGLVLSDDVYEVISELNPVAQLIPEDDGFRQIQLAIENLLKSGMAFGLFHCTSKSHYRRSLHQKSPNTKIETLEDTVSWIVTNGKCKWCAEYSKSVNMDMSLTPEYETPWKG